MYLYRGDFVPIYKEQNYLIFYLFSKRKVNTILSKLSQLEKDSLYILNTVYF
jgi:hypothetical protein